MAEQNTREALEAINSTPSKATRTATASLAAMRKALETLRYRGATAERLTTARDEMLLAIEADALDLIESERADRRERLDRMRERYESEARRNRAETEARTALLTRRYAAMTDQELHDTAMTWVSDESTETEPGVLDALSVELRHRDVTLWEAVREEMRKRDSYSPWTKSGVGRELVADLRQLENCGVGEVPYVEDGKRAVITIRQIDELAEAGDEPIQ
jgi:exonuclease VII large subunit